MNCYNCKECNGKACAGQIPGLGGKGSGLAFINNVESLKKYYLNINIISEINEVNTTINLFNEEIDAPIFVAPIGGVKNNYGIDISDNEYNEIMLNGCKKVNTIGFTGDGVNPKENFIDLAFKANEIKAKTIYTMKPWVDEGVDIRLKGINGTDYLALAMDIDSIGLPLLRGNSIKVETKSVEKLKQLKSKIDKPLILKGIMSVADAKLAKAANVDGIIVSNHGGRVIESVPATIDILADIVDAVGDEMIVLVDGGFRSGYDVFKALALGAKGVLIGRPFAYNVLVNKEDGLVEYYNKIKFELKEAMIMCGCETIHDIMRKNLHF